MLRRQRENMKKHKQEQEEKLKKANEEDEKKETNSLKVDDEGEEKSGDDDLKKVEVEEPQSGKAAQKILAQEEGKRGEEKMEELNALSKIALSVNQAWEGAEKKKTEGETKTTHENGTNENDTNTGSGTEEETKIDFTITHDSDGVELLPLLMGQTDPRTLLDRLNTRRLYNRVLHFKSEQRRKIEVEAAKMVADSGSKTGKQDDYLSIAEMYAKQLRDERYAQRVYRKNMTVEEMAEAEWGELIELAEIRNEGAEQPFDPIPTQHELLLFSPCPRAVAILASYPRSGNSLMRTLYEHTTLRVTGSDMQGGLAKHDLVGEMAVGANFVQFVKTHFPERQGGRPFHASRVVLLVRNPFDAMESYFNLMMTGTHTTSVSEEVRQKSAKIFEEYALREIRVWKKFHQFWMGQDIPVLLIRYEDLVRKPDKVMARVLQFVLEVQRMGTFFTERIDRCIKEQEDIERMGSYKPRSGGIGKSISKYPPALLKKLYADEDLKTLMGYLGYGDLLVKPVSEWSSLMPLKDYATEYLPSGRTKVVLLNRGQLARGREEQTPWQKIKVELGLMNATCQGGGQGKKAVDTQGEAEEAKAKDGSAQDESGAEPNATAGDVNSNDDGECSHDQVDGEAATALHLQ